LKSLSAKIRQVQSEILQLHARDRGRLLVITGARQCGKSTLASSAFADHTLINLDAPTERAVYEQLTPADWIQRFPRLVVDEAQKLPAIFETLKACYDRDPTVRAVLLGSSQILLLKQVRETLAGRAALRELFPFTIPEIVASPPSAPAESRLVRLLRSPKPAREVEELFPPTYPLTAEFAAARTAFDAFLRFGGMPALFHAGWTDEDRFEWLEDYHQTYLQRDLSDLARLDRLEPFVRAQKAAALRAAQTINFSDLARLAGVAPPTARQYMHYLELSYQIFFLPAWFRNREKRLAKQPKLHFVDPGIRRAILRKRGEVDGAELEGAVVAEVYKQCKNARLAVTLSHLRTVDGREVDLLIEREDGFIAIEVKQAARISPTDFRHLQGLESLLDKPLLLGLIVSNDTALRQLPDAQTPLWNVAAPQLLS
jgi:predicted AAA+ superfamily ATPase